MTRGSIPPTRSNQSGATHWNCFFKGFDDVIHHSTQAKPLQDHYAVSFNSIGQVLVQLQQNGEQVRVGLTPDEARHMAQLLLAKADAAQQRHESGTVTPGG